MTQKAKVQKNNSQKNNSQKLQNLLSLDITKVIPSKYNPRKTFDEKELNELAESINEHGIIQPITVRKIKGEKYEIVCGERRYRASLIAGKKTILSHVKKFTDKEAMEIAIIENLQRKDVSPFEEARAFQTLIDSKNYDIQSLAIRIGKSEPFVRTRLVLNNLIPDFVELIEKDEIKIGAGQIFANLPEELQKKIYEDHFDETISDWQDWRKVKVYELESLINKSYTTLLSDYNFDKSECVSCRFNTKLQELFASDEEARCLKDQCLFAKNRNHIYNKAVNLLKSDSDLIVCKPNGYAATNENVIEKLIEDEYPVSTSDYKVFPLVVTEPNREEYASEESYLEALNDFTEYQEECEKVQERIEILEFVPCVVISNKDAFLGFCKPIRQEQITLENAGSNLNTEISLNAVNLEKQADLDLIYKLESKKVRNNELRNEKINTDLTEFASDGMNIPNIPFNELEESLFYYYLLGVTYYGNFKYYNSLGLDYSSMHKAKDVLKLCQLSPETKTQIMRVFLKDKISHAIKSELNSPEHYLVQYMKLHYPEKLDEIKKNHTETYDKKNERLDERIKEAKDRIEKLEMPIEPTNVDSVEEISAEEVTEVEYMEEVIPVEPTEVDNVEEISAEEVTEVEFVEEVIPVESSEVDNVEEISTEEVTEVEYMEEVIPVEPTEVDNVEEISAEEVTEVEYMEKVIPVEPTEVDNVEEISAEEVTEVEYVEEVIPVESTEVESIEEVSTED